MGRGTTAGIYRYRLRELARALGRPFTPGEIADFAGFPRRDAASRMRVMKRAGEVFVAERDVPESQAQPGHPKGLRYLPILGPADAEMQAR